MPFRIRTLNAISQTGLSRLPADRYLVGHDVTHPDALLLRSASLHNQPIDPSVLAVARAGAGTNNIPVAEYSKRGIPVFNTPGANANAVKELVVAGCSWPPATSWTPPPSPTGSRATTPPWTSWSRPARRTTSASSCPAGCSA